MKKKNLFKRVKPFIDSGYMREIYRDEHFAIFSFGEISYLVFPYLSNKSPVGLLITAKEAEYIVVENPLYIDDLLNDETASERLIEIDNQTFKNYPTIIEDLKNRIGDEIIDFKTENRIKDYVLSGIKKCEQSKTKLMKDFQTHKKKLLIYLTIGIVLFTLQFVSIFTKDFRYQFDELRQAESFNKTSNQEAIYSSVECDFLTHLKSFYSQVSKEKEVTRYIDDYPTTQQYTEITEHTDYYLFGNSETKQFGIVSIDSLYDDEFDDVRNGIDANGFYKGEFTLYGTTSKVTDKVLPSKTEKSSNDIFVVPPINSTYTSNMDYSNEALAYFSEQLFELDATANFGNVYLSNASVKPERIKSPINQFLDTFILEILGFVVMVVGAFRHGLKLEKMIEVAKPLNGRIKSLKGNEYKSLNKKAK